MHITPEYWTQLKDLLTVRQGDPFPHVSYAKFVVDLCDQDIRYVPELGKWLKWSGSVWKPEPDDNPVSEALDKTIGVLFQWGAENPHCSTEVTAYVKPFLNTGYRNGIISAMKNIAKIRASVTKLDANPDLIACSNGTINLRTGEFYDAQPNDLLTRLVKVDYDPDADQKFWTEFLDSCHPNNAERIHYLKVLLGYAITGHTSEEISAFFHGSGANGKGATVDTIEYMLGDFSCSMPTDFWTKQYTARNGAVLGKLDGPRLCVSNEMSGHKLDEEFYKDITGGGSLSCNPKYGHPYDFVPKIFILWSGNERPRITNTDDSVWRRIKLIPWEESFTGDRANPRLKSELRSEANLQGVLAWLVEGAKEWYLHGLPKSESVDDATAEYRKDSNPNYDWAISMFEEAKDGFVSSDDIKKLGKRGLNRPTGSDMYWPKCVAATFSTAKLGKSRGVRGVQGIVMKVTEKDD
jgi:putative DNA primase/helicase